jgi:hypothetical protein
MFVDVCVLFCVLTYIDICVLPLTGLRVLPEGTIWRLGNYNLASEVCLSGQLADFVIFDIFLVWQISIG